MSTYSYLRDPFGHGILKKDLRKQREQEAMEKEAAQDVNVDGALVQGTADYKKAGYKSLKDLLSAKKRKEEDLAQYSAHGAGNFASLLGGDNRLG